MTVLFLLVGFIASNLTALLGFSKTAAPWRRIAPFLGTLLIWSGLPPLIDESHAVATQPWHAAAVMAALFTIAATPALFLKLMPRGAERA